MNATPPSKNKGAAYIGANIHAFRPKIIVMSTTQNDAVSFTTLDQMLLELRNNLKEAQLSLQRQKELLEQIKVFSRQPTGSSRLQSTESIKLLAEYGLKGQRSDAAKEALRCLANVLFLKEACRQSFVDLEYGISVTDRLADCDIEEEFLYGRLLFLLTYHTTLDFRVLIRQHSLADSLTQRLRHHASSGNLLGSGSTVESMAMSELLRLVFNIQHFRSDLQKDFLGLLRPISTILVETSWPAPVLQAPLTSVINALLSLDLMSAVAKDPTIDYIAVITSLVTILSRALREHGEQELEMGLAPLCTLLRRIYDIADPKTRTEMQRLVLPTRQDRKQPLGQGDSFSARLLRLTTSANVPTLRANISSLLFELSDKDAEQFVRNVGYGYASGFLMSNNIPVPVEGESSNRFACMDNTEIDPVTGQLADAENSESYHLPEMSEEEKEREAERLFVLFERLKATGVVDVKNPVEQYRNQ